ncbi:arginase family protein [Pseudoalteromonas sp. T1lg65]|uniref:arginase family protein n=1 Tax=Pseudoalteromonas sp. T1lg65 TaxID=2077101 RepID=UPI003F79A41C
MNNPAKIYNETSISALVEERSGETRVWQSISFLQAANDFSAALKDAAQFGIRYVIVGIAEDIGPRANCGKGGSHEGWHAFLKRFLNQPVNEFLNVDKVLLLGEVDVQDLQTTSEGLDNRDKEQLAQLRELCGHVDSRVIAVLSDIFAAGLIPIVIGGGHNNAFGILQAHLNAKATPAGAINFDPHADFRAHEGRHSGNGFSYAFSNGALHDYHVIGLHEQKNNQTILDNLNTAGFSYTSYQEICVRRTISITRACQQAIDSRAITSPLGIELDVDAIVGMPASALTYQGFSSQDAEHFVHLCASDKRAAYLHLCEAAPAQHPQGKEAGMLHCSQILAALVNAFLSAAR